MPYNSLTGANFWPICLSWCFTVEGVISSKNADPERTQVDLLIAIPAKLGGSALGPPDGVENERRKSLRQIEAVSRSQVA